MRNPLYISRRDVASGEWFVNAELDGGGVQVVPIAAGTYFNDAAVASASLCAALDTGLEATFPGKNFSVVWSTSTGLFTITCTTAQLWDSFEFGSRAMADWFGFDFDDGFSGGADFVNETGATGTMVAQGCVFAGSGRAKDTGLQAEKTGSSVVTEDGTTIRLGTQSVRRMRAWRHEWEPENPVTSPLASGIDDELGTIIPWTWFDFWNFHSQTGNPFRYYTEAAQAISAFEKAYWLESTDKFDKNPKIPGKSTFWTLPIEARVFTAG